MTMPKQTRLGVLPESEREPRERTRASALCVSASRPLGTPEAELSELALLAAIHERLESAQQLDLSAHRAAIVSRQVQARMASRGLIQIGDYLQLLEGASEERSLLHEALLVGYTRFFRDDEVFEALAHEAFDQACGEDATGPLKVWVPGCSTGEEAYSLAILLNEHLTSRGQQRPVRIFATDLRESGLAHGRKGVYAARACSSLAETRLARYFEPVDGGYRVIQAIRDQVFWARHDVARDPPFSNLDLLSCRNVLVYFEQEAQARILERFHFALRPGGHLLLGNTESTRAAAALFRSVAPKIRLYAKREGARLRALLSRGEP